MKFKTLCTVRLVSILSMIGGLLLGHGLLTWLSFMVFAWSFMYSLEIIERAFYEYAVEKRKEELFKKFSGDEEDKK